jgi:hypothetical protein
MSGQRNFREYLNEQLEDPEFKKEWDALEPEFNMIRAMIETQEDMRIISIVKKISEC